MKKIIIITALLLFVSSSAFAATTVSIPNPITKAATGKTLYGATTASGASDTSPLIGKTSTGVGVGVFCNAAGTGYSMVTQHLNGTKAYGSSYDSTSMFSNDVATVGVPLLAVPTAIDTTNYSSWTSL